MKCNEVLIAQNGLRSGEISREVETAVEMLTQSIDRPG